MSNDKRKITFLKKKKFKVIKINNLENKTDFYNLFKIIMKIGKGRILIETGLTFLKKLYKLKFLNKLYLFKSNNLLRNKGLNNTEINFIKKLRFKKKVNVYLDNDELFTVRIK
tara:strand:- start:4884 stop:5222 length:339 start_codon:yes stop_codon:yes gene_type:complete